MEPINPYVSDNGTNLTAAHSKDEMGITQLIDNASNQIISLSSDSDGTNPCKINILRLHIAFIILWFFALLVEVGIICVSLRGGILEDQLRWPAEYLLYVKLSKNLIEKHFMYTHCSIILFWTLTFDDDFYYVIYLTVLWLVEIALTICCVIWTSKNYISCSVSNTTKSVIIGKKIIMI